MVEEYLSDSITVQRCDPDAEPGEHPLHLVMLALVNGQIAFSFILQLDVRGMGDHLFLREVDPLSESASCFLGYGRVGRHFVTLRDPVVRLCHGFRKTAVVGENHKARRESIQSPSEVKFVLPRFIDEIDHCRVLVVDRCTDMPGGLVEHQISRCSGLNDSPLMLNSIKWPDETGWIALDDSVYVGGILLEKHAHLFSADPFMSTDESS